MLTATVRTPDGWAVPHAVVTLTDAAGAQVLRTGADDDGIVRGEAALRPGAYVAIVTAVGYAPSASTTIVTAAGHAAVGTVTLSRQGGTELPPPGPWTIDPAHSSVTAVAQHLGISSVRGRFTELAGRIDVAAGDVSRSGVAAVIAAASIDTGNEYRDTHLRSPDFLDVERFEHITYRSSGLTPVTPGRWTVHGELTLHGLAHPVDLDLTYLGTGADAEGVTRAAFRATTELRRDAFAIRYNEVAAAGVAIVGTTLKVELEVQAVQGAAV
ncbi:YceI family protein [Isoptericola sp. NPDC057191]|uniref:YceI family protein n=1 Tax=Isoptericola sp. NPDC057191 TaxID=3346041 RepID=UPI00363C370D